MRDTNYSRAYLKIDLGRIEHNFDVLSSLLPADAMRCAVVKADAYGHGAAAVAGMLESKVDYFAVATVDEGLSLRDDGIKKPILILTAVDPREYEQVMGYGLIPTIIDLPRAKLLSDLAVSAGSVVRFHAAVDTGMGRIGFPVTEEAAKTLKEISGLPGLELEGVFSHYAEADSPGCDFTRIQTERFVTFLGMLKNEGVTVPIRHICNSAAVMEKERSFDMVRIGIAMYGLGPSEEMGLNGLDLLPAMEAVAHVITVKDVPPGTGISYGRKFVSDRGMKVATISIGYADGYNRAFSDKADVLIKGVRCRVLGRVCMDQTMVDVSAVPDVKEGDPVTLMGRSGEETVTAGELGRLGESCNYEIICTFSPRMKKVYTELD